MLDCFGHIPIRWRRRWLFRDFANWFALMARKPRFPPGSVCKPCWELKYCPYGQLVELFPLPPITRTPSEVEDDYRAFLQDLTNGQPKTEEEVWGAFVRLHNHLPWLAEEIRDYDPNDVGCK